MDPAAGALQSGEQLVGAGRPSSGAVTASRAWDGSEEDVLDRLCDRVSSVVLDHELDVALADR